MITPSRKTKVDLSGKVDVQMRTSISIEIEEIYRSCPTYTYLSASVEWARENDIPVDELPEYLAEALKQKIGVEATELRMMKAVAPTNTLDDLFG